MELGGLLVGILDRHCSLTFMVTAFSELEMINM